MGAFVRRRLVDRYHKMEKGRVKRCLVKAKVAHAWRDDVVVAWLRAKPAPTHLHCHRPTQYQPEDPEVQEAVSVARDIPDKAEVEESSQVLGRILIACHAVGTEHRRAASGNGVTHLVSDTPGRLVAHM